MRDTEDGWWVGMMAPIDSMEGTLELGRIRIRAAHNEAIRKAFIEVLKMMIAESPGREASASPTGRRRSRCRPARDAPDDRRCGSDVLPVP